MPPALLLPALSLLSARQKDKFEGHMPACLLPTAANLRPTYGQLWWRGCLEVSWTTDVDTPDQPGPFPPRRTAPLRFPAAPSPVPRGDGRCLAAETSLAGDGLCSQVEVGERLKRRDAGQPAPLRLLLLALMC